MYVINIAKDFSDSLGARYYEDGEFSGQAFREEKLEPIFNEYDKIKIILDGTEGYATSFLEESFGGLVRKFPDADVLSKLEFVSEEDDSLIDEIEEYIRDAKSQLEGDSQ